MKALQHILKSILFLKSSKKKVFIMIISLWWIAELEKND